jgi:hypothetical protein
MGQKDKLNELQGKLSEIFDGIDDYYSQSILDELINRIDATIDDFNKDFKSLVGTLNKKPARRTRSTRKRSTKKRPSTVKKTSTVSKAKSTKTRAKILK